MPKDDINYRFTENEVVYDFYDVFVPAEIFREPSLWTWGGNTFGALGVNDTTSRSTPVTTILGGTNWKFVFGRDNSSVIKSDGTLWLWGLNNSSLGINNNATRNTPVTTILGETNWKSVAGGNNYTAAIKTDGTLWTWGSRSGGGASSGQLGVNDNISRSTPVTTILGGNDWKSVSCGSDFTAAIKTDGTLWVWGVNDNGALGVNDTTSRSTPVTTLLGGNNWKSTANGASYLVAIKTDGTLWLWGDNNFGQLGINDRTERSTPVTTILGGTNWKSVECGNIYTLAIKTDGTLWGWGENTSGQLGVNDITSRSTPVTTLLGGNNWKSVTGGDFHTAAIKTDGTLWLWGGNGDGKLGVNDTATRNTPVTTILGGNDWKSVACGDAHTIAIKYEPDP
jgi:alpha-tubulin suppressor-like RCC1 family protein